MLKHTFTLALATLIFATGSAPATATDYPAKAIQVIVPWAPGGGSDISARIVADRAKKYLSEPMVITNLTGASGLNGAQKVFKSPADGYTLLWEHPANLAVTPAVSKAKYSWKDFDMVGSIGASALAVFVKGDSKWQDMKAAVEEMKAKPDEIRWCTTPNAATGFNLYAIQEVSGGFKPVIIPAQGDKNRIVSVLGGNSDIAAVGFTSIVPYMSSGDVKVLAMCSAERSPFAPDVPTLKEQGINATSEFLYSILVPKGTPESVKKTLADAMEKAVSDQETVDALAQQGIVAKWRNAEETSEIWEEESALYLRLAKANGLMK